MNKINEKELEIGEFGDPLWDMADLLEKAGIMLNLSPEDDTKEKREEIADLVCDYLPAGYMCGYNDDGRIGIWYDLESEAGIILSLVEDEESEARAAFIAGIAEVWKGDAAALAGEWIDLFSYYEELEEALEGIAAEIQTDAYTSDLNAWFSANGGQGWEYLSDYENEIGGDFGDDFSGWKRMSAAQWYAKDRALSAGVWALQELL